MVTHTHSGNIATCPQLFASFFGLLSGNIASGNSIKTLAGQIHHAKKKSANVSKKLALYALVRKTEVRKVVRRGTALLLKHPNVFETIAVIGGICWSGDLAG